MLFYFTTPIIIILQIQNKITVGPSGGKVSPPRSIMLLSVGLGVGVAVLLRTEIPRSASSWNSLIPQDSPPRSMSQFWIGTRRSTTVSAAVCGNSVFVSNLRARKGTETFRESV